MANIYIETFGCQMNEADSQYIARRALGAGYTFVSAAEQADVLVLNTCTVRDNAERRAYGRMNHFKLLKDGDPAVKLVVTGCLAEQDRDRMQKRVPHIDAIFGTGELVRLGDALTAWRPDFVDDEVSEDRGLLVPMGGQADCITDAFSHLRAFVTVQRGCSYYCTFCIVPHVRGRFDHRPAGEILEEVRQKVAAGAREVMLVGQTVNAYKDAVAGIDFGDLCRQVATLPGLEALSFISPHPKDFTEKIVADLAGIPVMNARVHLPLQSASDTLLRRMNRKYSIEQYDAVAELFKRYVPHWSITTDLIVGFPGETEADFEKTLAYVGRGVFWQAFMFVYSPRRGTPAAKWEQVPAHVAGARFARLTEVQNGVIRAFHDTLVGSTVRGLIVGPSKKDPGKLALKTSQNVTLIAPKPDDYAEELYAREPWLDVTIHTAHVWGCSGSIVSRAGSRSQNGKLVLPPTLDLLAL